MAMDQIFTGEGTWHRDLDRQCWVRTDVTGVAVFQDRELVDARAREIKAAQELAAANDYKTKLRPLSERYARDFDKVLTLSQRPLLLDADWRTEMRKAIDALRPTIAEMHRLTPPPCMSEIHTTWLRGVDTIQAGGDQLLIGLNALDTNTIFAATSRMNSGGVEITRAAGLMQNPPCGQ